MNSLVLLHYSPLYCFVALIILHIECLVLFVAKNIIKVNKQRKLSLPHICLQRLERMVMFVWEFRYSLVPKFQVY